MSTKPTDIATGLEGLAKVVGNTDYSGGKIGTEAVCFEWVMPNEAKSGKPKIAIVLIADSLVSQDEGIERRKAELNISATWVHDKSDTRQHQHAALESMRLAIAVRDAIKKAMKDPDGNGISGLTLIEHAETGIEPRGHKDKDRVGWVGQTWFAHYHRAIDY
ncbi:MAG: hypothetical protein AAF085_10805 [Planctomycetota bacterium]